MPSSFHERTFGAAGARGVYSSLTCSRRKSKVTMSKAPDLSKSQLPSEVDSDVESSAGKGDHRSRSSGSLI